MRTVLLATAIVFVVGGSYVAEEYLTGIRARIDLTDGTVEVLDDFSFKTTAPGVRMYFEDSSGENAYLRFTYEGKTEETEEFASGNVRTQIGIKLRAPDSCNTLYAMWQVEEKEEIAVFAKRNPDEHSDEECGASGYSRLQPEEYTEPDSIVAGEERSLSATLEGNVLTVYTDDELAWKGEVSEDLLAPEGPAGMRSDNGVFEVTPSWE